jgi:putative DNA modification/repair radical SAM protein
MDKLSTLVNAAQFDACGCGETATGDKSKLGFVHEAIMPGGKTMPLFKVLLTNVCVNDCAYCVNQLGRDIPRCSFQSEELARMFMEMYRKNFARGLFLSSGIGSDASRTMESMIKVVEILRKRYSFRGYIHLKILPGAGFDYVEAGCRLASRVSVNMEAPTVEHLARLTRKKDLHQGIIERMRWVKMLISRDERLVPSGQTTQFVVGAAEETDKDILQAGAALYQDVGLRRIYFSAFRPISHSPLENLSPAHPMRQHRLYQTDWLLRVYGFSETDIELALDKNENLPIAKDPKLLIAQKQPWLFPVDVNRVSYEGLIRVPGIGPLSAKRIIETRQEHSITSTQQLKKMGVVMGQALKFIWFKSMLAEERQLSFLPQLEDETEPEKSFLIEAMPVP